jgi:hypothetical protein
VAAAWFLPGGRRPTAPTFPVDKPVRVGWFGYGDFHPEIDQYLA